MSNIFEPEIPVGRLGWTKTAVLAEILDSYFNESSSEAERENFVNDFSNADKRYTGELVDLIYQLIDLLATRIAQQQLQRKIELCKGNTDPMARTDYAQLALLVSSVCNCLQNLKHLLKGRNNGKEIEGDAEIKKEMRKLVKGVLQKFDDGGTPVSIFCKY